MNFDVVAERKDFVEKRVHKLFGRAARQICSANRAGKQTVANKNLLLFGLEENNVTGRVTGTMNDLETQLADTVNLAIAKVFITRGGCSKSKP